jgi:threonine dehydrogenase-like Zn-dependent dehydrogenase
MLDTPRRVNEMKIQFAEYALSGDQSRRLPQGDILAFGGGISDLPEGLRRAGIGDNATFQVAVKITKPGGTVSNIGYFGEGEYVRIPRIEWGVGIADKTIATGLCPGGRLRMERLLRVLKTKRVDPTAMTSHTFSFDEMERAFEVADKKLDDAVKALITF